ncbi:GRAM domain family protein [Babesia bovis T2Bo]|uniref:VASt domain-containing protein n=1 Tax=Babesia bovis TaxID=5865 RepID=A7AS44_BABBO|nr:GRAM domain family protein [Babesia bovis T2Bo]EDO07363.1 GRAM domain family protein [Babesia bovis T2Bo]|eukprot:XP_001610931.1 hypothetical protein [Babesia bovis T2Bo]
MRLSVDDSSDLSFVVSSYSAKCTSAKTLSSRLKNLLTPCKESSDLRSLLDYFLPYAIDRKLKALHRKIESLSKYGNRDSILSVSWLENRTRVPYDDNDDNDDEICTSREDFPDIAHQADEGYNRDIVPEMSDNRPAFDILSNALSDRFVNRHIGISNVSSGRQSIHRTRSEILVRRMPRNLGSFQSVDNTIVSSSLSNRGSFVNSNGYKSSELSYKSSSRNSFTHSDSFEVEKTRSDISGIQMLGQLCTPDFIARGCTSKNLSTLNVELADVSRVSSISRIPLCIDISEADRAMYASLCRILRGMLLFVDESVNHELHWLDTFDKTIEEVVSLLEQIVSDGTVMMKSLKDMLKNYSSTYTASVTAYEKALYRFQKFEKSLELALNSRASGSSVSCDAVNCEYSECSSGNSEFLLNRESNRGAMSRLLDNPKDFIRYTNYIEQMCLSHQMYDNWEKNRDYCARGYTEILTTYAEHYPKNVHGIEVECFEMLSRLPSVLLANISYKSKILASCLYYLSKFEHEGVIELHYSVNLESSNLKDRLQTSVVDCFECMRALSKKMAQLHYSQMDRYSRFSTRYPIKLCDVEINALLKPYYKYNKHMYTIWWSIYSTIATVFPKSVAASRKVRGTVNPVMGVFVEIKMPSGFLQSILKHFEDLLEASSTDVLTLCSSSISTCASVMNWFDFVGSLARENKLNPDQLIGAFQSLQRTISEFDSNSASVEMFDADTLNKTNPEDAHPLVNLVASVDVCVPSSTMTTMLSSIEFMAESLVDYEESDHNFRFSCGEKLHILYSGNTPLWYGHTISGINRWFPAKYVRPLHDIGISLFRRADLESYTSLDCHRIGDGDTTNVGVNGRTGNITLTSKSTLKQALMLSKLGLDGRVVHEFKCSLCRKIILRGTLYLTETHLGFISSFNDATLFGPQTTVTVPMEDIASCHLTSSKTLSFYVRVVLRSGEEHTFYSVRHARKIRDAVAEMAQLDVNPREDSATPNVVIGSINMSVELRDSFGIMEPLSKSLPPVTLHISLKDYFNSCLSDNVNPGSRLADTRLQQNAFDFRGDLEPVVFDWSQDGVFVQHRQITYSFRLKEGKYSSLLTRHVCGKAREELKYALVDRTHLIYESANYTSDIPYSNYFYTLMRITATSVSPESTVVKAEYDVKFTKSTLLSSVISNEASERLASSASMLLYPSNVDTDPTESDSLKHSAKSGSYQSTVATGASRTMQSFTWLCIAFLLIYTGLLSGWR